MQIIFDGEARMAETEALSFGNSKTETVRSAKKGIEAGTDDGVAKALLNAKFGDAVWKAADKLTGGLASAERRKSNEAIAKLLLSRDVPTKGSAGSVRQGVIAASRGLQYDTKTGASLSYSPHRVGAALRVKKAGASLSH